MTYKELGTLPGSQELLSKWLTTVVITYFEEKKFTLIENVMLYFRNENSKLRKSISKLIKEI